MNTMPTGLWKSPSMVRSRVRCFRCGDGCSCEDAARRAGHCVRKDAGARLRSTPLSSETSSLRGELVLPSLLLVHCPVLRASHSRRFHSRTRALPWTSADCGCCSHESEIARATLASDGSCRCRLRRWSPSLAGSWPPPACDRAIKVGCTPPLEKEQRRLRRRQPVRPLSTTAALVDGWT